MSSLCRAIGPHGGERGVCEDCLKLVGRRIGEMLLWQRDGEESSVSVEELLPDPDRLIAAGEILPGRGRGCTIARITLAGNDYVLKKFAYRGIWYGFRHVFKRSRALKVFVNQSLAHASGVVVPLPLLCLEERRGRFLRNCYLLDSYLPESRTLDACWDELSPPGRAEILAAAGRCYRLLHGAGILHGDSNWRNLLITCEKIGMQVWLIDFDNSRRPLFCPDRWRQRDLDHFVRDMRYRGMTDEAVDGFRSAATPVSPQYRA